jgi:hypothetical protein
MLEEHAPRKVAPSRRGDDGEGSTTSAAGVRAAEQLGWVQASSFSAAWRLAATTASSRIERQVAATRAAITDGSALTILQQKLAEASDSAASLLRRIEGQAWPVETKRVGQSNGVGDAQPLPQAGPCDHLGDARGGEDSDRCRGGRRQEETARSLIQQAESARMPKPTGETAHLSEKIANAQERIEIFRLKKSAAIAQFKFHARRSELADLGLSEEREIHHALLAKDMEAQQQKEIGAAKEASSKKKEKKRKAEAESAQSDTTALVQAAETEARAALEREKVAIESSERALSGWEEEKAKAEAEKQARIAAEEASAEAVKELELRIERLKNENDEKEAATFAAQAEDELDQTDQLDQADQAASQTNWTKEQMDESWGRQAKKREARGPIPPPATEEQLNAAEGERETATSLLQRQAEEREELAQEAQEQAKAAAPARPPKRNLGSTNSSRRSYRTARRSRSTTPRRSSTAQSSKQRRQVVNARHPFRVTGPVTKATARSLQGSSQRSGAMT